MQKPGTVLIINGPSGSGKTSLQKEFQQLMLPELWVKLGIDTLFDAPLPDITPDNMQMWTQPNSIRWVTNNTDTQEHPSIPLHLGSDGSKVITAMHKTIATYAAQGCNCIVDYIAYQTSWLDDLQAHLTNIPTYWIALDIDLATLEQREAKRGTSPVGHARSHYDTVYGTKQYDLRLQANDQTSKQLAHKLKALLS